MCLTSPKTTDPFDVGYRNNFSLLHIIYAIMQCFALPTPFPTAGHYFLYSIQQWLTALCGNSALDFYSGNWETTSVRNFTPMLYPLFTARDWVPQFQRHSESCIITVPPKISGCSRPVLPIVVASHIELRLSLYLSVLPQHYQTEHPQSLSSSSSVVPHCRTRNGNCHLNSFLKFLFRFSSSCHQIDSLPSSWDHPSNNSEMHFNLFFVLFFYKTPG